MGFNAAILRRRRRLGGGSGLFISAPSAVLFADGDQPFSLDGVNAISFADTRNPVQVVAADYFVDSVNGDNGNDGSTTALAFADIATTETAATGSDVIVGLARGSSWSEIISDTAIGTVQGYGQGVLPILDATIAAPTWTQPDAGTYPNVWSASIDHEMNTSTNTRIIVLEDGVMMPRQTSIANVNSNETSRYSPSDGSLPSNDPATVYIHATGGGNPNTNGKTYLITIREGGVHLGDDATVKDVELRSGGHSNGTLECGRNATIQRVLMRDCGKHHMFMEGGGALEDCVAVAADVPLGTDGGQALYVAYDDSATGQSATLTRAFAINGTSISQPLTPVSRNAHYAHSQGGQLWDEVTYEQSASIDLLCAGDFSAGDATQFRARGCFARGTDKAFNVGGTSYCRNAEFLYNQCQNAQTGMFDLKPNGACAVTIRHNVLAPWNWGLSRWMIDGNSNLSGSIEYNTFVAPAHYKFIRLTGGTVTHRYNVYVMNEPGTQNVVTLPSGVTSDYNVYINLGAGQLKYTYNGTEYGSLAAYQAATGQEANSLEFIGATLGDIFSGTVTDGDFRINAAGTVGGQIETLGAGAQYHWNWNSRAVASGPATQWPVIPENLTEARQYVNHPAEWDFYGDNDPAFDSYTLTMSIEASGTIDFDDTAYAAVTENSGADASGAIDVTGTLAQINALFADPEPVLDNWSSETLNASMTITHVASGRTASKTISVESLGALQIETLSPEDDATGVAYNRSTYTATFNRAIQAGTGNVVLKLVGGAALETFDIVTGAGDPGGTISISGADLIISPSVSLTDNTAHAIQIASTAIDSVALGAADSFAGIADDTTWSFTCENTAPTLSSPLDSETGGTTATAAVTTDRGDGILYWVVTTSSTTPTHDQIVAGDDHTDTAAVDSGSQAVTTTGSQAVTGISGLTSETTYYTHFTQVSVNSAEATPVSADGFTTDDVTAPAAPTLDPADNATDHPIADSLVATFDENVQFSLDGGTIRLYNASGPTLVETFTPTTSSSAGNASISGATLTINPASDLTDGDSYYVLIDANCIEDTSGNAFAGFTAATDWNFTAVDASWVPSDGFDSATLQAWYDASDTASITAATGQYVTAWDDQTVNGRDATNNAPTSKKFTTGHLHNGLNKITSQGAISTALFTTSYTPSGSQLWVAAKVRRGFVRSELSGSSVRPFISFGNSNVSLGTAHTNDAAGSVVRTWDGTTVRSSANSSFVPGQMATIIMQFIGGTSMQVWLDGTLVIDEAAANPTLGQMWIGGQDGSTGRYFPGDLCEIIVGTGTLTSGDRDNLNTYMERWDSGRTASVIYNWTSQTTLISNCGAGQGVAEQGSGNSFFASEGDSGNRVRIYDNTLTFDNEYNTTSDNSGAHSQITGMWYDDANDKLYICANNFSTTPKLGWVYEYDFNTSTRALSFVAAHSVGANYAEGVWGLSDGTFLVCFHDINVLRHYNSSWTLIETLDLSPVYDDDTTNLFQGIAVEPDAVNGDMIYLTIHGSNTNKPWMVGYLYEGGQVYEAFTQIALAGTDCRQGIHFEGSTYLFAERTSNDNSSNNNIVRATPVKATMDVG